MNWFPQFYYQRQGLGILLLLLLMTACTKAPELKKHNDPNRYTVARDVLWASPKKFDLTMDIYSPSSGREFYPVVVMFHGGGFLLNDKSIMDQAAAYLATNSEWGGTGGARGARWTRARCAETALTHQRQPLRLRCACLRDNS